jgi:citrate lyase beta subunit
MIDALELGATLYVPATRADLAATLLGGRIPGLRSAVICVEDAVAADDVELGLKRLAQFLRRLAKAGDLHSPLLFVRPRDTAMLGRILLMPGADRLAGFVLPKVTAATLPFWLAHGFADRHRLMPTLETRDAFDGHELRRLRDQLLAVHDRILAIRIGGNDLLQTLGARRSRLRTAYDGPLGPAIATLVATFAPWDFALSAPVMEGFDDTALLREEVARDIEHGLLTKTAIHPVQIAPIQAAYAVPARDLAEAEAILADTPPAVFASGGAMCEPATHRRWAVSTRTRAALFGVADPLPIVRLA